MPFFTPWLKKLARRPKTLATDNMAKRKNEEVAHEEEPDKKKKGKSIIFPTVIPVPICTSLAP